MYISSCSDERNEVGVEETPAFKAYLEKADQRVLLGEWKATLRSVDSVFRSSRYYTLKDTYNYYVFFYDVYSRHYKDYDRALLYTDSMERLLKPYKLSPELASQYALTHYWRGDVYFYKGRYTEAYQEYFEGRKVGQQMLDACMLSDYSYRLGMILYQQERYYESLIYFKEANIKMVTCENDFTHNYRAQEVYGNIALCFFNLDMLDSAESYFNQALKYQEEKLTRETPRRDYLYQAARAVTLGNLASVYERRGDNSRAEKLFKETIHINVALRREPVDGLLTNLKLARLYYKTGDMPNMFKTLNYGKALLDTLPNVHVEKDWNMLMSKYYASGKPESAYQYLARYEYLRDSIAGINKALRESDVKEHLKNIERQQEITDLEQYSRTRKIYLAIAIIVAVISLVVVVFIIYYLRRMRRYVKLLNRLNLRVGDQKKELRDTLGRLEASNQEKDKIMRVVAHDMRSPIAAIYALADITLSDPSLTEEQRENLELIKTASNNSLTLSKEILDSASVMEEKTLNRELVNIAPFMADTIELLRFRAAEKNQVIELSLPGEPIMVQLDKDKFGRVISNIVTNAIKFSNSRSVIQVKITRQQDGMLLAIKDSGVGIPERAKDKVFDMFTTAKREGTNGEKPFGLGLSISRQIVEAHKGKIWFESVEGEGTVFYVSMPLG